MAVLAATPAAAASIVVVDGDTIRVGAEKIRILGLDAPEIHGRCEAERVQAAEARGYLRGLLAQAEPVIERRRLDKYRRTLARVTIGGRDVADLMIRQGLARPYHGERRRPWCNAG